MTQLVHGYVISPRLFRDMHSINQSQFLYQKSIHINQQSTIIIHHNHQCAQLQDITHSWRPLHHNLHCLSIPNKSRSQRLVSCPLCMRMPACPSPPYMGMSLCVCLLCMRLPACASPLCIGISVSACLPHMEIPACRHLPHMRIPVCIHLPHMGIPACMCLLCMGMPY